jgi:L-alanine-DL-glutamate epimerase-like enolase superfamily enzyme
MALWDLTAKLRDLPLHRLLAERFSGGRSFAPVEVTAACGYYSLDPAHPPLATEIERLQGHGYRAIEVRIGGLELEDDLEPLDRAIRHVGGADRLAVNAAGGLDEDPAIEYAEALANRGLRWFAEPGDPLDYELFEELTDLYPAPLAAGGRCTSVAEVRNLLRYSALRPERDLLLLEPASLGLGALLDVLSLLPEHGWQRRSVIAAGGLPIFALQVVASLGLAGSMAAPLAFPPVGDLGPGVTVVNGEAKPPDAPGIGFETHPALSAALRQAPAG